MDRRLATILVADIVGSTAAMARDEEGAVRRFHDGLGTVGQVVDTHSGRVFNRAGDAVLAEFASPVNALRAAMAARAATGELPAKGPELRLRFGLHLADVVDVDGDLRGDGVNIAARIQAAADPGAIDASDTVFQHVRRNAPCVFDDLGERSFKGVDEPLRIFRVRDEMPARWGAASDPLERPPVAKRAQSVAVLPLQTAGLAPEDQRYLAQGIAEDIIHELGRFRQLLVASPTASMSLDGRDPKSAGDVLGVRYVLTGSVRSLGDRLRLNLALASTEDGTVIWTTRIQEPFDRFVDVLDAIAEKTAATVLGRVLDADIAATRTRPAASLSAYECFLRGLDYHRRGGVTDENVRQALHWLEKAIDLDPGFARARAMWACSASWLPDFDWDKGRAQAVEALEQDPNEPEAHRIMGSILMKEGKFDAARPYHRRAMELAPNDAYIIGRSAAFHIFAGEPDEALRLLDRAEALDPLLPTWITEERIAAFYGLGRFDETVAAARSLPFQTRRSRIYKAAALAALGQPQEAARVVAELRAASPDISASYVRLQETYRDPDIRQALIDRLVAAGLPAEG